MRSKLLCPSEVEAVYLALPPLAPPEDDATR